MLGAPQNCSISSRGFGFFVAWEITIESRRSKPTCFAAITKLSIVNRWAFVTKFFSFYFFSTKGNGASNKFHRRFHSKIKFRISRKATFQIVFTASMIFCSPCCLSGALSSTQVVRYLFPNFIFRRWKFVAKVLSGKWMFGIFMGSLFAPAFYLSSSFVSKSELN